MPDNKNFHLRINILDGLLRKTDGVTMQEMLQVVNKGLDEMGIRPVRTKDTILKDLIALSNEYKVSIVKEKDALDYRVIRYRYENTNFSIFDHPLKLEEIHEIRYALSILSNFRNFPLYRRARGLCEKFGVPADDEEHPLVVFQQVMNKNVLELFESLYRAILEHHVLIIHLREDKDINKGHVIHPYLLKQFNNRWFLIGMENQRHNVFKVYPLENLISLQRNTKVKFIPNTIDIGTYFSDIYGVKRPQDGKPVCVVFHVHGEQMQELLDFPIHKSQVVCCRTEHYATMSIFVIPNDELIRKFLSLSDAVTIVSDCDLREEVIKRLKISVKRYESST